jgi:hypothetical protein
MAELGSVNMQRFGVDVERRDDGTTCLGSGKHNRNAEGSRGSAPGPGFPV